MLKEKVSELIKEALKSSNPDKVRALRGLMSALQVAEKSSSKALTEEDETKVLLKSIKQREESLDVYTKQGRQDLAEVEEKELLYLREFLPKQLSDEELIIALTEVIQKNPGVHPGKLTGLALKEIGGKSNTAKITETLKSLLANV